MCEIIVVVCVREAAGGEGVPEKEPGIQNQKQQPHTKLWGTIINQPIFDGQTTTLSYGDLGNGLESFNHIILW